MIAIVKKYAVTLCLIGAASWVEAESSPSTLSPELSALLKKEMQLLDSGVKNIFSAYYSGNYSEVSTIAKKIEDSFILKQSLSSNQKVELHNKLPKGFVEKDKQFHYYAGMLSHVAENKKDELIGFYLSKLIESCQSCHAKYAYDRFPGFSADSNRNEHHH